MFRSVPIGPQPAWKKPLYLVSTIVLWMLLSVFLQLILLFVGHDEQFQAYSFFTGWRMALVVTFGIVGFFVGRMWWQWIYVEGRWSARKTEPPHA